MEKINAEEVLYIKLGLGGKYVEECFQTNINTVKLDYREIDHELCRLGQWTEVKKILKSKHKQAPTTNHLRQIQAFYESGEDTGWITFHDNKWW